MTTFALEKVEVAQTPQQRFEEFLQSRGKRITRPRRIIIDQVFSHHEHFDADELLAQLRASGHTRQASRPTVYRTLTELVDAGLLRKMTLGGRFVYEHDYGYPQHDHLYCQSCHKMIEFQHPGMENVLRDVCGAHNFQMQGHSFVIRGVCGECNRARITKRRLDLV